MAALIPALVEELSLQVSAAGWDTFSVQRQALVGCWQSMVSQETEMRRSINEVFENASGTQGTRTAYKF